MVTGLKYCWVCLSVRSFNQKSLFGISIACKVCKIRYCAHFVLNLLALLSSCRYELFGFWGMRKKQSFHLHWPQCLMHLFLVWGGIFALSLHNKKAAWNNMMSFSIGIAHLHVEMTWVPAPGFGLWRGEGEFLKTCLNPLLFSPPSQ